MGPIYNNKDQELKLTKSNYAIVKEGDITYIEELRSTNPDDDHKINTLAYKSINFKTPKTRSDNRKDSVQVAIANLNYIDNKEVLAFIDNWGLLGLKQVKFFEETSFEERKGIQYHDLFRSRNRRNREPLSLIKKAVYHYKELLNYIEQWDMVKESTTSKDREKKENLNNLIKANINLIIRSNQPKLISNDNVTDFEMELFSNSLYGFIYASTVDDLIKDLKFKKCLRKTCRDYFKPTRLDRVFCSIQCGNAVRKENQRIREKAIEELIEENPTISKEEIKKVADQNTNQEYVTIKAIKERFYIKFKKNI